MKFLRASRGPGDIERIRSVLDDAGIAYVVRNELIAAGSAAVPDFTPEIWVTDDERLEHARELVAASESGSAEPSPAWTCPHCGETIDGQFDSCWRCAGNCGATEPAKPGPGLSLRNVFTITVVLLGLGALLFSASDTRRRWRIAQTKPFVDGVSLEIDNLYLYSHHGDNILRVFGHWIGGNPTVRYDMTATLRTAAGGSEPEKKLAWRVGIFGRPDPLSPSPFVWELSNSPTAVSKLYLRLYYQSKEESAKAGSIDFEIPYLPRVVLDSDLPGRNQLPSYHVENPLQYAR